MNANTSKTAGAPTPAAEPTASQASESPGANTATADDFDIAGALGLPAEGQETEAEDKEPVDADAEATKGDDESPDADEADPEQTETEPAAADESAEETAPSDEAAPEAGASEEGKEEPAPEEPSPEEEPKGKTPEWAQKRFDELTAARKSAEEEAKSLREQNSALKAAANGTLQGSPLDFIDTPQQLDDLRRDTEKLNEWAIRNRNGGALGERDYSAEEVAAIEAETSKQLRSTIPERSQYVQAKQHYDQLARQTYAWLGDTKQGDGATVQGVLERYPQLRALPNHRFVVANALLANRLLEKGVVLDNALIDRLGKEAAAKKAGTATPAKPPQSLRKPPAAPARAGTMPARTTPRAAQQRHAEQRVSQSNPSMDDIAESIAAKL